MHRLKLWTPNFPNFEMIYSLPKIEPGKYSKFYFKFRVYAIAKFWVQNFHVNFDEFLFIPHLSYLRIFFLAS